MKNTEVFNKLLSPINDDIIKNEHYRECPEISDLNFVHIGVLRVLGNDKSGRAFLQRSRMEDIISIDNSIFFKSLNSKRRLMHLIEVDKKLTDIINHELIISDRLKGFKGNYKGRGNQRCGKIHINFPRKLPVVLLLHRTMINQRCRKLMSSNCKKMCLATFLIQ